MKRFLILLLMLALCLICTACGEKPLKVDGIALQPELSKELRRSGIKELSAAELFNHLHYDSRCTYDVVNDHDCSDDMNSIEIRSSNASFKLLASDSCKDKNCNLWCDGERHEIYTIQCSISDAIVYEEYLFQFELLEDYHLNTATLIEHNCNYKVDGVTWYRANGYREGNYYVSDMSGDGLIITLMKKATNTELFNYGVAVDKYYEHPTILTTTNVVADDYIYAGYYYKAIALDQFEMDLEVSPGSNPNWDLPNGYILEINNSAWGNGQMFAPDL